MQIKFTPADVNEIITAHLKASGVDVSSQPVSFLFKGKPKLGGVALEVTIGTVVPKAPRKAAVEAAAPVAEAPVTAPAEAVTGSLFA